MALVLPQDVLLLQTQTMKKKKKMKPYTQYSELIKAHLLSKLPKSTKSLRKNIAKEKSKINRKYFIFNISFMRSKKPMNCCLTLQSAKNTIIV